MEFLYTINPTSKTPIMLINKAIGEDGIRGSQFQEELFSLSSYGAEEVIVYINSVGGSVIDGMSIYNAILESKIPVITINVGIAASIASVIFLAGKKRIMYDYSVIMVHNPFNSDGSEDKSLDIIRDSIITMLSERSNCSEFEISEMMNETTWIHSDKALKLGLCDEIKTSSNKTKEVESVLNLDYSKVQMKWEQSDLILNKLINKNNNDNMNLELIKILNEAGIDISNEASETEVYNIVKALIAKNESKSEDEGACNEDEDGAGAIKAEDAKNMEDKYNALEAKYNALVAEMENKKAMEMEDKINTLINNALSLGKIKNSSVDMCKAMAKMDFNTFEKFIKDLPVNKTATKIEAIDNKLNLPDARLAGYVPDAATLEMNRIANKLK